MLLATGDCFANASDPGHECTRKAKESIIGEWYFIPTVDGVLKSLNQSAMFSEFDLKWLYVINQKRVRVFDRGFQTPRNR